MVVKAKMAIAPAVLMVVVKCECGLVNLSLTRDGIDKLSHGGTGTFRCTGCGLRFQARAACEERAMAMLPDMLPGQKSQIWINPDLTGATDGVEH